MASNRQGEDRAFGSSTSVLGPRVQVRIEGSQLAPNVLEFISNVKVEIARDKADLITFVVANPLLAEPGQQRTSKLPFTDHRAFAPGNTVEVFFSYDNEEPEFCAAGIIQRTNPTFPRAEIPTIRFKALDALVWLMDGNSKVPNANASRSFGTDVSLAEVAAEVLADYGFDVSGVDLVTPTPRPAVSTIKSEGKSDYQLLRGLANTLGWEFFTEYDGQKRKWVGHFRPPVKDLSSKGSFTWGPDYFANGEVGGILLDFDPELSIKNVPSDIEVFYYDEGSRTWERIVWPKPTISSDSSKKKEEKFRWKGDDTTFSEDLQAVGSADSARGLRIQAGGEAVEVVPKKGFRSSEEAVRFAEAWFRARMDLLIQGNGSVVGYPKLKPNQVHALYGLGAGLSGDWFFNDVTHVYQKGGGGAVYENQFLARKVIP